MPSANKTNQHLSDELSSEQILTALAQACRWSPQMVDQIRVGLEEGATSLGEVLGFNEAVYNSMEDYALAHYSRGDYPRAFAAFSMIVNFDEQRASAWRGMAASLQQQGKYMQAANLYEQALLRDPDCPYCYLYAGECLIRLGEQQAGRAIIEEGIRVAKQPHSADLAKAIRRSQGIATAQGTLVSKAAALPAPTAPPAPEAGADDMRARIAQRLKQDFAAQGETLSSGTEIIAGVIACLERDQVSLREVAGYSQVQLDAGYRIACMQARSGQHWEAIQTVAWLLLLDSQDPRYLQLIGICLHHLGVYCSADYFYRLSLIYEPHNAETMLYRAEVQLHQGDLEGGLDSLEQALRECHADPQWEPRVRERAEHVSNLAAHTYKYQEALLYLGFENDPITRMMDASEANLKHRAPQSTEG